METSIVHTFYQIVYNLYVVSLYQSQTKRTSCTHFQYKKSLRGLYAVISQGIHRSEPWSTTSTTGDTHDARFEFFKGERDTVLGC